MINRRDPDLVISGLNYFLGIKMFGQWTFKAIELYRFSINVYKTEITLLFLINNFSLLRNFLKLSTIVRKMISYKESFKMFPLC